MSAHVSPCLPISVHVYPYQSMSAYVRPCQPMFEHISPCLSISACVSLCETMSTPYQLISAHASPCQPIWDYVSPVQPIVSLVSPFGTMSGHFSQLLPMSAFHEYPIFESLPIYDLSVTSYTRLTFDHFTDAIYDRSYMRIFGISKIIRISDSWGQNILNKQK